MAEPTKTAEQVKEQTKEEPKKEPSAPKTVLAAAKTKTPEFAFSGKRGGAFTIRGTGFGAGGVVTLNGQALETTGWGADMIVGRLPKDAQPGEVVVQIDAKTAKHGRYDG